MKIKITLISILIIFLSATAQIQTNSGSVDKDSLGESPNEREKEDLKNLLEIIISVSSQGDPWVQRKEIAAWAATVLYLTIIGLLVSNYRKYKNYGLIVWGVFLYSLASLWLFAHFVNEQFGSVTSDIARRGIHVYKLVELKGGKGIVPYPHQDLFNMTGIDTMEVDTLFKKLTSRIRSYDLKSRIFLPLKHIHLRFKAWCNKDNWKNNQLKYWGDKEDKIQPGTLEMEEAIQYNIMIMTFIFFSLFLLYFQWKRLKEFLCKVVDVFERFF